MPRLSKEDTIIARDARLGSMKAEEYMTSSFMFAPKIRESRNKLCRETRESSTNASLCPVEEPPCRLLLTMADYSASSFAIVFLFRAGRFILLVSGAVLNFEVFDGREGRMTWADARKLLDPVPHDVD